MNNSQYYYYVVSYVINKQQYLLNQKLKTLSNPTGYYKPYVSSSGLTVYKAVPHKPSAEYGGIVLNFKWVI